MRREEIRIYPEENPACPMIRLLTVVVQMKTISCY